MQNKSNKFNLDYKLPTHQFPAYENIVGSNKGNKYPKHKHKTWGKQHNKKHAQ